MSYRCHMTFLGFCMSFLSGKFKKDNLAIVLKLVLVHIVLGACPVDSATTDPLNSWQGSFPVRERTGTLRIGLWRAREREPIWGSGGGASSGVQGQSSWSGGQGGEAPLKLKAFYCRREQICHSHLSETWSIIVNNKHLKFAVIRTPLFCWILFIIGLLNFAAICRKGPERRSGDQKRTGTAFGCVPARNEPCVCVVS